MAHYRNKNRPGIRTTTTADPKLNHEDIDFKVATLSPEAIPLQTLSKYIGRGKPPVSHKVQVIQEHLFDNFDFVSAVEVGQGNNTRLAKIFVDQISRPDTAGEVYYYPQDKIYIVATGQMVEVVMNPRAALTVSGQELSLDAAFTGNTVNRTEAGSIIVRNIVPAPIKPFTKSDVIFTGRTIYESQNIEAEPQMRDYIYDCNFVEHKEKVLVFTEDQKNLVKQQGVAPDWNRQQKSMIREFKLEVEHNAFFSEREVDMTEPGRPKRHMRGLMNTLKTNVAYYDPAAIVDFEAMLSNFLFEQAFRYNQGDSKKKVALCGGRFLYNFNMAFREYRRTTGLKLDKSIELDAETYVIPGGFNITLMRNEVLRQNTPLEDWCFVIEPSLMEWRIVKDYNSRAYQNADERDMKLMIEWQGTVAWQLEQCHALLRTSANYI